MPEQMKRSLEDPRFDAIDHALGRPKDPMKPTFRDFYCVPADRAQEFEFSNWWRRGLAINRGKDVFFHVTCAGRAALAEYLRANGRTSS